MVHLDQNKKLINVQIKAFDVKNNLLLEAIHCARIYECTIFPWVETPVQIPTKLNFYILLFVSKGNESKVEPS
jgi:hypothetical protein